VNIYLDDELWQAFRMLCLQQHISASQQIGLLLAHHLHEHGREKQRAAEAEESP
jgi:hypothetical protein